MTLLPQATIREAMSAMTSSHIGLMPVVDTQSVLVGVVSDGDVRRALLEGVALDSPVTAILNRHPVVVREGLHPHEVSDVMRANGKYCVPVVDAKGCYVRMEILGRPLIPNCVPCLNGREQALVAEALLQGMLAIGPAIERFEQRIASFVGAEHAVAVSCGTAALHLAMVVAGIGPGDEVIIPTLTFAATANAVRYCGAWPLFVDVCDESWGMDAAGVRAMLESDCERRDGAVFNRKTGRRVRAIMPVHLFGHPVDLDPLIALADEYGLALVEDGAEALGASYKGRMVGSLHDLCCLSFNGNKIITGGAGGMILTRSAETAKRLRYLASQAKDSPTEFVHGAIGYNYRLPNVNAALLLAQAEMLPEFIQRKRHIVQRYSELLADLPGVRMRGEAPWAQSSHWMAILELDPAVYPDGALHLRHTLMARGIEVRPVWTPLHRQAPFADCAATDATVSERLYSHGVCLPCSCGITEREIETVTNRIHEYFALRR